MHENLCPTLPSTGNFQVTSFGTAINSAKGPIISDISLEEGIL